MAQLRFVRRPWREGLGGASRFPSVLPIFVHPLSVCLPAAWLTPNAQKPSGNQEKNSPPMQCLQSNERFQVVQKPSGFESFEFSPVAAGRFLCCRKGCKLTQKEKRGS